MTREEAAMKLSLHLMQCGMLMPIEWVQRNGEGSETSEAFQMAIAALREQDATDINVGNKWISVKEKLPERNAKVLCYMDFSKNEETKHWENSIADNVYNGVLVGSRPTKHVWAWQGDCVTHWMPLPEPPKEEV